MSDEGFHEIQLNGKQLVFLFMAATVVSVVIFLCGVMVGRGVRDRTMSVAAPEAPASSASTDTASATADTAGRPPVGSAATTESNRAQPATPPAATAPPPGQTPPPPPQEDDDYYNDLVKNRKDTSLATSKSKPLPAPPKATERSAAKGAPSSASTTPVAGSEQPSTSSGYAVQLAAVRERGEADAIAQRLVAKGYQAYVLVPQPGKPPVYRVQVGRFKSRGDADKVASRLRKNEQFKPWVTR